MVKTLPAIHGHIQDEPDTVLVWAPIRLKVSQVDKYFDHGNVDAITGAVISAMKETERDVTRAVTEWFAERASHRRNGS